jgi:transposase-like protein
MVVILRALMVSIVERMVQDELDAHLKRSRLENKENKSQNRTNGFYKRTLMLPLGTEDVRFPRDRNGEFTSAILPPNKSDFCDLEKKVVALYSRGMSTRDIASYLLDADGYEVSHVNVANMTNSVLPEMREWLDRPLKASYPFLFIDGMYVDVRTDAKGLGAAVASKRAIFTILGIDSEGYKEVLGFWVRDAEGSKEWLNIFEELKARGVANVCVVCADGLRGMEEAVRVAFGGHAKFQRCLVHIIRNATKYVPHKSMVRFCADFKTVYGAVSKDTARINLNVLAEAWEGRYPGAIKVIEQNFSFIEKLFEYPLAIRRIVYTTNAIESVHAVVRKGVARRGCLPNEEALLKLIYLRVLELAKKWDRAIPHWPLIRGQLEIVCPGWDDGVAGFGSEK